MKHISSKSALVFSGTNREIRSALKVWRHSKQTVCDYLTSVDDSQRSLESAIHKLFSAGSDSGEARDTPFDKSDGFPH